MSSDQVKKIKRYIKDDRPKKLQSYVQKYGLNLSEVKLKQGRNLMHYCCKYGTGHMLKYLIRENVNGLELDKFHNLPVHLALQRSLDLEQHQEYNSSTDCYTDLILPLIERFPGSLDIAGSSGDTCRTMLYKLVKCTRRKGREESNSSSSSLTDEETKSSHDYTDDIKWRDKLAAECEDEYYSSIGRFEQDFEDYTSQQETYDDWADRIRSEYDAKKRSRSQAQYRAKENPKRMKTDHTPKTQAGPENLEDIRAKMREKYDKNSREEEILKSLKNRLKYEKRYKEVLDRKEKADLRYCDIPWPSLDSETVDDIQVLFDGMDKTGSDFKKYLRDQQIRWHPDKFLQRFGDYLKAGDKERVLERVTSLSQSLNKLST